jgi:hypothetical protein
MSWHVEPQLLLSYARGRSDLADSFSVEAHVLGCAACRDQLAHLVDRGRLERVWAGVEDAARPPGRRPLEAVLVQLGVPDHLARLLVSTRSLTLSWIGAVSVCLAFAVTAAQLSSHGLFVFLGVAPLLPLAGVAVTYGPGVDPAHEISLASPMRGFRLLMIRAAAVLVVTIGLAAVGASALPELGWLAAAWLLPSLALTALALALATYVQSLVAFWTVAAAWIAAVALAASESGNRFAAFGEPAQAGFVVVSLAAAAVVVLRREAFDREGRA